MKKQKLQIGFTIILIIVNLLLYAQNQKKIDSLFTVLKIAKADTNLVKTYNNICWEYQSSNPDTALYYVNLGLNLAIKINYKNGISKCYLYIGMVHLEQGSYDKALEYFLRALKINEDMTDKKGMSMCYNNIGNVYLYQGNYAKAIDYYLKSLKIKEESGDKNGMSNCYTNIGNIHYSQGSYAKSLDYYLKALKIKEESGDKNGISNCYNNIGIVHKEQKHYNKAIEYYLKALKIKEELGNKNGISNCYNNIGIIYKEQKLYNKAIEYYLKVLKITEESGDKNGIALVLENIASLHIILADSVTNTQSEKNIHYNEAVNFGLKSYNLGKEIKAMPRENDAANTLMNAYKKLGNFKKSVEYSEIFIATNDSMFKEEKTKALAGMEAKYQNEKKQLEIDKLSKEKELQLSENRKQKIVIGFVVSGLILLAIIIALIFRSLQITHRQKRIIEKQKQLVDKKNSLLTDSILYAERIQKAVLPRELYIKDKIHGEFFIIYKPKDIVSGDFYFIEQRKNWLLIAVADCTGHGVPGAFMSMLGISFLNEIIAREEIQSASYALDELRNYVIHSLQQKGTMGEQQDGMDIAFIALNTLTNELQFAGANNPLYLIQADNNNELTEIKGDKMPVSIHKIMTNFTNHTIQLQKGDIIYLASDGYEDQFGGPYGKKFLIKKLKQLLSEHCLKSMNEQKEILETTLEKWKNGFGTIYEQIDDITVLGLKI